MRLPTFYLFLTAILISMALAGCASSKSEAAEAIENYLNALVAQDAIRLTNYSCTDWEAQAQIELDALTATSARLEGLECREAGQDGSDTLVTCMGRIVFDYNGELQELDLEGRTFTARQEGGEWRMCGYK